VILMYFLIRSRNSMVFWEDYLGFSVGIHRYFVYSLYMATCQFGSQNASLSALQCLFKLSCADKVKIYTIVTNKKYIIIVIISYFVNLHDIFF